MIYDFGSGHAGLNLLVQFQPDIVKIDIEMVRDVDTSRARQVIIAGVMTIACALQLKVIAESVETEAELSALREAGIELCQGFLFAKPAIETQPPVSGMLMS